MNGYQHLPQIPRPLDWKVLADAIDKDTLSGYLTFVGVIQSAALGLLVYRAYPLLKNPRCGWDFIHDLLYPLFYLFVIIAVSHSYTWFGSLLRYVPKIFWGWILLFFLGAVEISGIMALGGEGKFGSPSWWLVTTLLCLTCGLVYIDAFSNCKLVIYEAQADNRRREIYNTMKWRLLANVSLAVVGCAVSISGLVNSKVLNCPSLEWALPLLLVVLVLMLMRENQTFIDEFLEEFGLERRLRGEPWNRPCRSQYQESHQFVLKGVARLLCRGEAPSQDN
jgi:hypothetical protein